MALVKGCGLGAIVEARECESHVLGVNLGLSHPRASTMAPKPRPRPKPPNPSTYVVYTVGMNMLHPSLTYR